MRPNLTAIIYDKRGRVLSIGKNSYVKTHPLQVKYAIRMKKEHSIYLHAEIHAITRCTYLERAHKIVITRVNRKGDFMNAKPCDICMAAISETPIKHIEYTT